MVSLDAGSSGTFSSPASTPTPGSHRNALEQGDALAALPPATPTPKRQRLAITAIPASPASSGSFAPKALTFDAAPMPEIVAAEQGPPASAVEIPCPFAAAAAAEVAPRGDDDDSSEEGGQPDGGAVGDAEADQAEATTEPTGERSG